MNVEENRLRTFSSWPVNAAVDCNRIARAGFYYTGHSLEVQCFSCGGKISEWNYGDQVMARHRQLNSSCPFVRNPSNTFNVPLVTSVNSLSSVIPTSSTSQDESSRNELLVHTTPTRSYDPRVEFRTQAQRLRSFMNWPVPMIVSPERLAKAGFYYLQEADMVECAFCRGVVMKWEPGDDPHTEHRLHFPNCDFHVYQDEPMSSEKIELGNVKLTSGVTSNLTELGIQTHSAPRQPKHATYEGRLRTYQGWPETLRQTPQMLADAGFYYVGVEDQVRCFYCDGGLRNWETTDDAWTEHARWFPRCGFVALVRGQEFIKHCIDNRPPLDPSILGGVSDNGSGDVTATPVTTISTVPPRIIREVTDNEIEELLSSPVVLAALEVGLHVGRVRIALRHRMEQTGIPYISADQLIDDALHVQFREDDGGSDTNTPESPSGELTNLLNRVIATATESDSQNEPTSAEEPAQDNVEQSVDQDGDSTMNTKIEEPVAATSERRKSTSEEDSSVSLEEENRRLKEARLCKICMDREVGVVFLPCGHLSTCVHCAPSLKHCPMCRQEIRATVRTFLA